MNVTVFFVFSLLWNRLHTAEMSLKKTNQRGSYLAAFNLYRTMPIHMCKY